MRSLPFDAAGTPGKLLDAGQRRRGQRGAAEGHAAGRVDAGRAADLLLPTDVPPVAARLLRRIRGCRGSCSLIAARARSCLLLLLPAAGRLVRRCIVGGAASSLSRLLRAGADGASAPDVRREADQTPAAVDQLPGSADFPITEPGSGVVHAAARRRQRRSRAVQGALRDTLRAASQASATGRARAVARPARSRRDRDGRSLAASIRRGPSRSASCRRHRSAAHRDRLAPRPARRSSSRWPTR